eukprot:15485156-Alexandrium_andersonii.AAC.1
MLELEGELELALAGQDSQASVGSSLPGVPEPPEGPPLKAQRRTGAGGKYKGQDGQRWCKARG